VIENRLGQGSVYRATRTPQESFNESYNLAVGERCGSHAAKFFVYCLGAACLGA